jgi:hypothetical protein
LADWNQTVGVQFADWDIERPFVQRQLAETVDGRIDTFADADSCRPGEQHGIGKQIVGSAQFLLQQLIIWLRQRSGQRPRSCRQVLDANEVWSDGMAVGGQILEQTAEVEQIADACFVAQGWIFFAQAAEPAEQMGITAELREPAEVWKGGLEIA